MSAFTPMTLTSYDLPSTFHESVSAPDACQVTTHPKITQARGLAARSKTKRLIDLVGAGLALMASSPILVVAMALIRIGSPGPILFRQLRMGLNGKMFWCFKLRTMVPDAEARLVELESRNESAGGVLFKIKSDPRVTPLGRFLRRSSIDELPQLWNVLVGEMSLVGPRPLQLRDSAKLAQIDPEGYSRRLSVVPGVTGPWQVGGRSGVDSNSMLKLDLDYVEGWSVKADMTILFKTVGVVLLGKGAS